MKIVYSHENKIIVENAKNYLLQNGVEAYIRNEFSSGGLGELAFTDTWPQLCVVNDNDFDKGIKLIEVLTSQAEGRAWSCLFCNEKNEPNFEICWHCHKDKA